MYLYEWLTLSHVSNKKLWENKNHENKEKSVRVKSDNGGKWGEFPPILDHWIDAI